MVSDSLALTLGALEIGILISGVLFGLLTMQVYTYLKSFPQDLWWIKVVVNITWLIDCAHTACIFHTLYFFTIIDYANPLEVIHAPASQSVAVVLHSVTLFLVQAYFVHRIYKLSEPRFTLAAIGGVLVLVRFAFWIVGSVVAIKGNTYQSESQWTWMMIYTLTLGVFVDSGISATLVYYFMGHRGDAVLSTLAVIDRLILFSIETGIVTTLVDLLALISFSVMPGNLIWFGVLMVLPKVFSNALLANLNSRIDLRRVQEQPGTLNLEFRLANLSPGDTRISSLMPTRSMISAPRVDLEAARARGLTLQEDSQSVVGNGLVTESTKAE